MPADDELKDIISKALSEWKAKQENENNTKH